MYNVDSITSIVKVPGIYGSKTDQVQGHSLRTRFVDYSYKSLATCAIIIILSHLIGPLLLLL